MDGARSIRAVDEQAALRAIVEGTAGETGEAFYGALVESLARTLGTSGAWVTEYDEERRRLRALAFWLGGERLDGLEYDIRGTPCETAINETRMVHIPDNLLGRYVRGEVAPGSIQHHLGRLHVESYLGMPLLGEGRVVLGHVAVLDAQPLPPDERVLAIFQIFANRARAEMRRLRLEADLREREQRLGLLVGSAMDAIVELDAGLRVTLMNSAAERVFGCGAGEFGGSDFLRLLEPDAQARLPHLIRQLDEQPRGGQSLWIAGGLAARRTDGTNFPAEATLSRYEVRRRPRYTLILRNVDDRIRAEQQIHSLSAQTEYLREEIKGQHDFEGMIGRSERMAEILRDVKRVATTDASVLITGETGTGKELVARAIHEASRRRDRALITVNCAAVPATLIESEFFGHERGAFTGATKRRQGRFDLADGGTIFLDEVGDLGLELQAKLLRVLQEGEFEPVGSSRSRKVDVRVLAATNRDLEAAIREGRFREDLYYRLNVFPLRLPPLRERGDDVVLIAESFANTLAAKLGVRPATLSAADAARLRSYAWPGNVRELRNVIERALITSPEGVLRLEGMLPGPSSPPPGTKTVVTGGVLTDRDLREVERENLLRALQATGWRVGGAAGAATLLGVKPSTLRSRMAALGIERQ
ncbi:MAG TPA: sigma 54-interacting transcriptional regulator [Planctomycetota bacterium]|nr:sigma 54-interacting transcriptional regulator [Planctomycetota bacterium]